MDPEIGRRRRIAGSVACTIDCMGVRVLIMLADTEMAFVWYFATRSKSGFIFDELCEFNLCFPQDVLSQEVEWLSVVLLDTAKIT